LIGVDLADGAAFGAKLPEGDLSSAGDSSRLVLRWMLPPASRFTQKAGRSLHENTDCGRINDLPATRERIRA